MVCTGSLAGGQLGGRKEIVCCEVKQRDTCRNSAVFALAVGHVSVARAICIVPRGEITGAFSVGVNTSMRFPMIFDSPWTIRSAPFAELPFPVSGRMKLDHMAEFVEIRSKFNDKSNVCIMICPSWKMLSLRKFISVYSCTSTLHVPFGGHHHLSK